MSNPPTVGKFPRLKIREARNFSWPQLAKLALSAILLFVAIAYVIAHGDWTAFGVAILRLSWISVAISCLLMLAGAMLASLRLQLIARDLGYSLHFRDAASALGLGQLIGSFFFQVVGQIAARSAFLSRRNIPVSGTIIATGYERLLALVVSLVLAVGGAIYLFGRISFDQSHGGILVVKLIIGICTAGLGGALLGWWRLIKPHIPGFSASIALSIARNLGLSLAIQLTTMAAYVVLTKGLAGDIPTTRLMAASTLVMLGASLPISLAGWGMREMSAILALGAIGVSTEVSLAIAVMIGLLSISVVGLITLITLGAHWPAAPSRKQSVAFSLNYGMILDYALALAAATAIFIQAFVPIERGNINLNLADPMAIVGGCLFVVHHWGNGWPSWRIAHVEYYVASVTLVIVLSFLHGLSNFGWTDWAFANKVLGWFVLLAYATTGALIVGRAKRDGLALLLRTYAASGLSIVVLSIVLLVVSRLGLHYVNLLITLPLEGFSANRNAFAFQLLLAVCAICAGRWKKYELWLGLIFSGLFFAGSRAVLIGLVAVIGMVFYLRAISLRAILTAIALAISLFLFVNYVPGLIAYLASTVLNQPFKVPEDIVPIVITASDNERIQSLVEGWAMFLSHPIFGAGLGAYLYQQMQLGNALIIHSTPLWLLAETGLLGFVIIVAPIVRIFYSEITHVKNRDLAGILLILIVTAFGVVSNAHEIMYQRAFWLFLGAALACARPGAGKSNPAR